MLEVTANSLDVVDLKLSFIGCKVTSNVNVTLHCTTSYMHCIQRALSHRKVGYAKVGLNNSNAHRVAWNKIKFLQTKCNK